RPCLRALRIRPGRNSPGGGMASSTALKAVTRWATDVESRRVLGRPPQVFALAAGASAAVLIAVVPSGAAETPLRVLAAAVLAAAGLATSWILYRNVASPLG